MNIAFIGDAHLTETSPRSRKDVYYESILEKIKWVIEQNDVSIFLGDLLHKPVVSNTLMYNIISLFQEMKSKGKELYAIVGNHDVTFSSVEEGNLIRCSLNILFKIGLLKELKCESFGPLVVEAIPFLRKTDNLSFHTDHIPSMLIGHYFYESPLDPHFSILSNQIKNSGYVSLILGHDHEPHEPVDVGGTTVIIPGSISRSTTHKYNLERTPRYCRVVVDDITGTVQHSFEDIPCKSAMDVFNEEAFSKPTESTYVFMSNMASLLEAFKKVDNREGVLTVKEALNLANAPETVVDYLRGVYQRLSLNF